jgi:hypothetical protein
MSGAFSPDDWQRLRRLRDRFLTDATGEYWTARDLELYDATFAQRIAWKWADALNETAQAGWRPAATRLIDWGCGTGIAGRVVAEWSGIRSAEVFDQSAAAMHFAAQALRSAGIEARRHAAGEPIPPGTLLVLSHVAGELTDPELSLLADRAATAEELIWVEPGSREISRRLGSVRATLQRAGHRFVAPCTHQNPCPMFAPENERHWCHFFAPPPTEVFQSAFWHDVSRRVEIDLRSLPYSYLASTRLDAPDPPPHAERLIGHPRERKGHCQMLCCGPAGLHERPLQKRDHAELYRAVVKRGRRGRFTWDPAARTFGPSA